MAHTGAARASCFPSRPPRRCFAAKFLARLDAATAAASCPTIRSAAPGAWQDRRRALLAHDWVIHAKPPPGGPPSVLDYLARWHRTACVSNDCLHFWLRCGPGAPWGARQRNRRQTYTVSLPTDTFIGRFPAPRAAGRLQAPAPLAGCSPAAKRAGLPPPVRHSRRWHHKRR